MAKWANDQMMDDALNYVKTKATILSMCNAQPTTAAEALSTYALGTIATATGNMTLGNGDSSGRKVTHAAATLTVGTSGTVSHVAFTGSGSLLFVGTCAPTAVTAAGTVILSAWDISEIADPV
jgi:hypothetical protein